MVLSKGGKLLVPLVFYLLNAKLMRYMKQLPAADNNPVYFAPTPPAVDPQVPFDFLYLRT